MNRAMLSKYEQELEHLRSAAGEFARQNPKIASRLALDEFHGTTISRKAAGGIGWQ